MAVYLSPGVFPVEIDLSALPTATGPLLPVFIGTAQQGPINTPTFVSSSQEFIDTFGNPIDDSPLGFAVLNYMEEGNEAWILRVGIEAQPGQDPALAAVAIDTSGANIQGWGRMPLFTGIDSGRLTLRTPSTENPFAFHVASVSDILFTNAAQQGNAPAGLGPVPVNLNTAANYTVFGETGITASTPGTVITGDIAVSPIAHTALVGFNLTLDGSGKFATSGIGANGQVTGKIFASDYAAPTPTTLTTAVNDILNAYNDAAGRAGAVALTGSLNAMTLAPGLYKQIGALTLGAAATVTLNGGPNDVWIIQVTGALTTGAASNVVLTGGAQPGNVFWQVAGGVTLGAASNFEGVILSATTITLGAGAAATSRLLAQTAVTLDDDTIVPPPQVVFSPASVTLNITGTYTGPIEDSYNLVITGAPDGGGSTSTINGATFQIVRNSDGSVTNTGTLIESGTPNLSDPFLIGVGADNVGLTATLQVLNDVLLQVGDVVSFETHPDNRTLELQVEGLPSSPVTFTFTDGTTYATTDAFVAGFNSLVGVQPFIAEDTGGAPQIVTVIEGNRIQLMGTEAFALQVGVQQYAFDIPRSYLLSGFSGPFNISSLNDRVKILSIGPTQTVTLNSSIPDVLGQSAFSVASALDLGGVLAGHRYYDAFLLTVAVGDQRVAIVSSDTDETSNLQMQANFSNVQTLKFAEELDIPFPYTRNYRGFNDPRVALPQPGLVTPALPHSCELSPSSAQCAADTAYFQNIVGWLVATTPGTWVNGLKVNISLYNNQGNKYTIQVFQGSLQLDRVDNVSFDQTDPQYIGNIVNPGSSIGGTNGNAFYNWEARPTFLNNDPSDLTTYEVRNPVPVDPFFVGGANGIPPSAIFSSALDAEIIGNPATSTGMFAFQNPEKFDVSLLLIPGNSSGAVIGQALQLCESRGDMLYIVDPPFGLRPQQVVDWHNGMLFSDLTAAIDSSYGALYWPWLKIFNQFDATELFVPPSGFVAQVFSRTARVREQWFAPAGLQRGHLNTALDVEYNASQGERDLLYGLGNAVNPIVNFPQDGITVFGQRTLQRQQTALDRVNVRMLLIFLKKNLVQLLRFFLFEPIDLLLFAQVRASITPFLQDVMARRGLTAFKVICDATNNTPETIDRNELHVSVLLKPTKAAEFIVLNLVILRSDASFSADEVLAAAGVVGATTQVI